VRSLKCDSLLGLAKVIKSLQFPTYLRIHSVVNINTLQRFDATISAITQTQGETMIK